MAGPVVCGVASADAGPLAGLAAAYAARLGTGLVLVHAAAGPFVPDRPHATHDERRRRAETVERAGLLHQVLEPIELGAGVPLNRVVAFGEPAEVLREIGAEHDAAFLVVARRRIGMLDRAALGSTSSDLARESSCPVLVVPDGAFDGDLSRVIVCAVDGTEGAADAARAAAGLARDLGDDLVLVAVAEGDETPAVGDAPAVAREIAGDSGIEVEERRGPVADEVAACARERRAEMLVTGSRGRGPIRSALLGSVSTQLLGPGERPVLVVPPEAATAD
jgi:nucleotide-binding universal stress UspA family protein